MPNPQQAAAIPKETLAGSQSPAAAPPATHVQVVQHLRPGGIESLALDLANTTESGKRNLIISLDGDVKNAVAHWPRLQKHVGRLLFQGKAPGISPGLVMRLAWLFRRHRVEVVHTHHIGPLLYAGLAARLAGVPCLIHTEHDAWHLQDKRRRLLQKTLLRLIRPRLVADADTVSAAMRRHLGPLTIQVIRNGIDTDRFVPGDRNGARETLGLPPNVPLVGCAARLERVKGQHTLIEALSLMPETVHLAMAGTGSTETALKQQARELGMDARVHFLGHVEQMPRFYQSLDVFCLPSLNEGLPLSTLEAQACGIPAAATDVGGSSETLAPNSGALIKPGDARNMATTLEQMLRRPGPVNPRAFVLHNGDLRRMRRAYDELKPGG